MVIFGIFQDLRDVLRGNRRFCRILRSPWGFFKRIFQDSLNNLGDISGSFMILGDAERIASHSSTFLAGLFALKILSDPSRIFKPPFS